MVVSLTKEQLKEKSRHDLYIQFEALRKDINALLIKLDELTEKSNGIKEASAETINVIAGVRRDIKMCNDSLIRVRRLIDV